MCSTKVDENGVYVPGNWGDCDKNCPVDVTPWSTNDTLKVIHVNLTWPTDDTLKLIDHSSDLKDTIIALKLFSIMSFSLLLIALMVKVLGISAIWFCKYVNNH